MILPVGPSTVKNVRIKVQTAADMSVNEVGPIRSVFQYNERISWFAFTGTRRGTPRNETPSFSETAALKESAGRWPV